MIKDFRKKMRLSMSLAGFSVVFILLLTILLFRQQTDSFEAKTLDWRYVAKIKNMSAASNGAGTIEDIVIIDIDNRSLEKLGRYHQWPRSYHADVINYLTESGALAIVFDVLFMEQDLDSTMDNALVQSTKTAMNVVHAFSFSSADPDAFLYKMKTAPPGLDTNKVSYPLRENVLQSLADADRFDGKIIQLYNASSRIGFANYLPDNDSVVRRMPLFMKFANRCYPSLGMATILHLMNITDDQIEIDPGTAVTLYPEADRVLRIPIDKRAQMLINYKGAFKTFRYVPFYDVLEKRIPPEFFKDKVTIIGASAPALYDMRPAPFSGAFPGVEINANIICNILTQDFIKTMPLWQTVIILFLAILFVSIVAGLFRKSISLPFTIFVSAFYIYLGFVLFTKSSIWIELIRPTLGIWVCYLGMIFYRYHVEQKDKRRIKNIFQFYMSTSVVNEILKKPGMLSLGGERKIASAFFSDIKSFTTISEKMDAEDLVTLLNEYFSEMTDIVIRHEGYLNKYQGDAIVALYGIPLDQEDHALRACYTSLDMQEALRALQKQWHDRNLPVLEARIGINSGPMVVGNIGGAQRFDYTAIGDSVNLASRLESANKMYGTDIIISEDTFRLVNDKLWVRELDFIRVKGKQTPVRIYEVLGRKSEKLNPVRSSSLEYYVQGLELYRQRNWVSAYDWFQKALQLTPTDGPSLEFIRRCKIFIESPRPEDWDGVFNLRSK